MGRRVWVIYASELVKVWIIAFFAAFGFYWLYFIGIKGSGSITDMLIFSALFASSLLVVLMIIAEVRVKDTD